MLSGLVGICYEPKTQIASAKAISQQRSQDERYVVRFVRLSPTRRRLRRRTSRANLEVRGRPHAISADVKIFRDRTRTRRILFFTA